MLRDKIEDQVGPLTDEQFIILLNMITDDIRFHYVLCKKKISLKEILIIAKNTFPVVLRVYGECKSTHKRELASA